MQNVKKYKDEKIVIGYNDKLPPEDIAEGRCEDALNVFLDQGKIIERNGYSLTGNDTNQAFAIRGLGKLESGNTKHVLKVNNDTSGTFGYIFKWTGSGNWSWISTHTVTPSVDVEMEQASAKTYIVDGTSTVYSWDGTTLAIVAAFPICKYIRWFHNYMFAAGNPTHPNRLYISNLADPETWGGTSYIDINADDGDFITRLDTFNDQLIIFKVNRIWSFSGWDETTFSIVGVNEQLSGYGLIAPRCCVNTGNDLIFLSFAGDIPHFRSLQKTQFAQTVYGGIISDDIQTTMQGLSITQLTKAAAVYDGKIARFFVPNGSSTTNNLMLAYDVITTGWTRHTGINASVAVVAGATGRPVTYFGEAQGFSRVYQFDSSTTDNGTIISSQFISRAFQSDDFRKSKFKYLYVEGETTGNISEGVSLSIDHSSFMALASFNLFGGGLAFPYTFPFSFGALGSIRKRYNLAVNPAYTIQVKLTKADILARSIIRTYEFWGYPRALRSIS